MHSHSRSFRSLQSFTPKHHQTRFNTTKELPEHLRQHRITSTSTLPHTERTSFTTNPRPVFIPQWPPPHAKPSAAPLPATAALIQPTLPSLSPIPTPTTIPTPIPPGPPTWTHLSSHPHAPATRPRSDTLLWILPATQHAPPPVQPKLQLQRRSQIRPQLRLLLRLLVSAAQQTIPPNSSPPGARCWATCAWPPASSRSSHLYSLGRWLR
jgi:hypothetical protein